MDNTLNEINSHVEQLRQDVMTTPLSALKQQLPHFKLRTKQLKAAIQLALSTNLFDSDPTALTKLEQLYSKTHALRTALDRQVSTMQRLDDEFSA